jgi:Protein of unknown function (DUF2510)
MAPTPAGWYPVDAATERWWDGETWTEHTRPSAAATPGYASAPPAPRPRKPLSGRAKLLLWLFLAFQLLTVALPALGVGLSGHDPQTCGSSEISDCSGLAAVGAVLVVFLFGGFWLFVDVVWLVIWLIVRSSRR